MKKVLRPLALLAILAITAAACNDEGPGTSSGPTTTATTGTTAPTTAPTTGPTTGTSAPTTGAGADITACEVTDTGGIDDKSFNATAYKGLTDAQEKYGITPKFLESQTQDDYAPNIQAFIGQCQLIVTVGFLLGDATQAAATENPDQNFAIVDFAYDPPLDNVLALTFQTDQAAFLAGYLAAGTSKSGVIGTFGGINIPTVTIFMNGLAAGILAYNADNSADVQLLGWDPKKQDGTFTGDFEDQNKGKQVTEQFISEGADIILPVAGPVGLGAAAAAKEAGNVLMIGVDTDQFVAVPEYKDLWLTSILKNMDVAVSDSVGQVVDGSFKGGTYSGTLENDGVGLAPFHELEDQVPADLASKLDELKAGIIDGSVSVDPKDYL